MNSLKKKFQIEDKKYSLLIILKKMRTNGVGGLMVVWTPKSNIVAKFVVNHIYKREYTQCVCGNSVIVLQCKV